ncbi:hypothetical protein [Chryseolinea lacunae]|uniref:Uncharacterized protein n=1 Tax=Chryseolinea lacunae TaxID=2801331 RepID=A0ABS1KK79_9BACT|nr:hypothetical protein [Chryseolinea lacunae]MBL0739854.1 hypothetical protein [Chryseolinea lacunae]
MPKSVRAIMIVFVVVVMFYFFFGLFVVKPTVTTTPGLTIPGATIVYLRVGLALPFIASADGLISARNQTVDGTARTAVLIQVKMALEPRMILSLPYSERLYLRSTGGVEYK